MVKKFRSILSIVLVALMLFSLFVVVPITVSAAGEIAGNGTNGISININASPYTDYAKKDYGQYAYTNKGCAWFASARVCQVTGKNTNILSGSSWYSTGYSTYGFSRGQSIKAKALACYSNHVAVVEIVNGNTVTVSEGGMPSYPNNGYCVIRTTTVSELQNRSACGSFLGYVYIGGGGSTPAPSGNNPIGYLDSVSSPSAGKIRVTGWALDLDQPTSSIAVHIYVGGPAGSAGAEGHPITANTLRSDVGSAYSKYGVGNYHGFDVTFSTSKTGSQSVYAYGINVGNGSSNTHLTNSPRTVNITPAYNPQGYLDNVDSPSPGKLHVRGWAFDKDNVNTALTIHIYVGGPAGSGAPAYAITANKERADVNKVFPGVGNNHGFDETINVSKSGTLQIYAYAINIGGGTTNPNLTNSPKTVTIKQAYNPQGYLDNADSPEPGKLHVRGWAFDKDDVNTALDIHIYVGGPAGSGAPCYAIKANKERTDVNKTFPGAGNYHGFDETITVSKSGNQSVYAYAINIGGGTTNPNLTNSPKTVNIKTSSQPITPAPTEPEPTDPGNIKELEVFTYNGFECQILENNTIEITKYIGSDSKITVPSKINGKKVTSIGHSAFSYCQSIKSVTISEGIETIDHYAFKFCMNLNEIKIPNSVTRIKSFAFEGCQSLTDIKLPEKIKAIEYNTFSLCSNLENVSLPNGLETIGENAFSSEKLNSIYIPESVYDIQSCAFAFCTNLEKITVNENNLNYTSIDGVLYDKCMKSLVQYPLGKKDKKYIIPNGITDIKGWAICCGNLNSVVIPKSVNNIEENNIKYKIYWANDRFHIETFSYREIYYDYSNINIYGYPYTYAEKHFGSSLKLLEKKTNTIKIKTTKSIIKSKRLKKKAQKVKAITVKNAQGKVTYKLVKSGISKKIRKLCKINSKGVITIKKWKKAKKGTYKIKVKVTAAGNSNYNAKTITKTIKIKIK